MTYPKYVRLKGKSLYYQRDYPTKIYKLTGTKTFSQALKLNANATENEIATAALNAAKHFDLDCKVIQNSDINAYNDAELDMRALRIIEKAKLEAGQLEVTDESSAPEWFDNAEIAEQLLGEENFDDILDKANSSKSLTIHDAALLRARHLLTTAKRKKPVYLSQLWDEYVQHRGLDTSKRPDNKALVRWNRFFGIIGEQAATKDLIDKIVDSLQDYADMRKEKQSSTVERELSDIMSCLKLGSKRHRLKWHIERPYIKPTNPKKRSPVTRPEQLKLIEAIYSGRLSVFQKRYAVLALLYLQGGMMTSEVQRLTPSDISLNSSIPYLLIRNKTKTEGRKRVLPIVVGVDYIKDNLEDTVAWLQTITEATWSRSSRNFLRTITGNKKLTPHCYRHSFKANALSVGADTLTIASIAGWSDAQRNMSEHLLDYGSEGITSSESIQHLWRENKRINAHLILHEEQLLNEAAYHESNVIRANFRKS